MIAKVAEAYCVFLTVLFIHSFNKWLLYYMQDTVWHLVGDRENKKVKFTFQKVYTWTSVLRHCKDTTEYNMISRYEYYELR